MKNYQRICTFRLDDITPDMDWNKFYRIRALFIKYKVNPLIGVVPDNRDPGLKKGPVQDDFWEVMRSLQKSGWSIAQHGYQHVYETTNSGILGIKNASEFAGLSYDIQRRKIHAGREILQKEGLNVTIFMAPGHTFDKDTLRALRDEGFKTVTDGYAGVPYYREGLLFVPCKGARLKMPKGLDTICIHTNEFEEQDFHELQDFLEKHRKQIHSYDEVLNQIWYPQKWIGITLEENSSLAYRQIKQKVATSEACQQFLQETYSEDPACCKKNRIMGFPKFAGSVIKDAVKKKSR